MFHTKFNTTVPHLTPYPYVFRRFIEVWPPAPLANFLSWPQYAQKPSSNGISNFGNIKKSHRAISVEYGTWSMTLMVFSAISFHNDSYAWRRLLLCKTPKRCRRFSTWFTHEILTQNLRQTLNFHIVNTHRFCQQTKSQMTPEHRVVTRYSNKNLNYKL